MNFTLGHDVEVFLQNEQGDLISSIGKFGGNKGAGIPMNKAYSEYKMLEDNVALEFNVPSAECRNQWATNISILKLISNKIVKRKKLEISPLSSAIFPDDQLADERAWVFGCEPDFNAWTGQMNTKPVAQDPRLRSCGGHIHIGIEDLSNADKMSLCKYLDFYVGMWCGLHDPDFQRRELYGKAGAMRFKPYGLEYRTPSNWWYTHSAETQIYDRVHCAIISWSNGVELPYINKLELALNEKDNNMLAYIGLRAQEKFGVSFVS
jgi:hypothetical protein